MFQENNQLFAERGKSVAKAKRNRFDFKQFDLERKPLHRHNLG